MRLGISTPLQHSSAEEWAEKMEKLGMRSVVFPVDSFAEKEVIENYRVQAEKHELMIAEVGIWRNALAEDPKEQQAVMDYSIAQLKLADSLGARCCVNVAGAAGKLWDGPYRENFSRRTWERTVRMVQEVIDEARPEHTFFTLEPMPWMVPTGPEEYDRLLSEVNREHFGVHMDGVNWINSADRYFNPEEFLEKCFSILGKRIRSCHLKDVHLETELTFQLKECPCGEGEFPLEKYVELIDSLDPEMPVIIEHLSTDEQYESSAAYVKKRLGLK